MDLVAYLMVDKVIGAFRWKKDLHTNRYSLLMGKHGHIGNGYIQQDITQLLRKQEA